MFGWFKKKKSKDEVLREQLREKLKDYATPVANDVTDTTWTEITLDDGSYARVPKYTAKAVEELTLTEFEEDVTIVGLDTPKDPWANMPDSTQWHRAEKHGK